MCENILTLWQLEAVKFSSFFQVFNFSDQKTWFLEINSALSKFSYEILHYLVDQIMADGS